MALESERATIQDFCHKERFSSAVCSRGTTGCEVKHPNPTEPTLACSEVVERLATCVTQRAIVHGHFSMYEFDREQATAILHSWRERRVQELEDGLRGIVAEADQANGGKGARLPIVLYMKELAEKALANSEQIRKGAKHE